MSAGVFNAYFAPSGGGSSSVVNSYGHVHSGAIVNTWTSRIVSGGEPVSFLPGNPVDVWTGITHTMNR